jgi:hypothetical protein
MKWIIVVALVGIVSLASCQNDSRPEAIPQSAQEEAQTSSTSVPEVESVIVKEDLSLLVEAETASPIDAADTSDSRNANADVLFVKAQLAGDGTWTFAVTVEHPDSGWEDYADGWDILLPDGTVVKRDSDSPFTRLLLHPHETEQPFTRSQSGIKIPPNVEQVTVRAHDLVDGFGGIEVVVDLTAESGPDFEVVR